jgi:hypothetical protein
VPAALFLVGGVSVLTGAGGGLYWVLAGAVAGFTTQPGQHQTVSRPRSAGHLNHLRR